MTRRIGRAPVWTAIGLVIVAGCGGGDDAATGGEVADDAPAAVEVDPATVGTIAGVVNFDGAAPAPESVDMSEEPTCADKHGGAAYQKPVAMVSDGKLGNVFVYLKEGVGAGPHPQGEQPVLDQDGCVYEPHVMGVQAGQEFIVRNSDGILHNVNAAPETNRGFNISQPTDMESTRSFASPEIMVPVRCDVHGWMEAYIGVLEHPYFAVTGGDGSYRIVNVPPGDYVVETWHERYGTQTQNVTVAAQQDAQADFNYSESMAAGAVIPLGEPVDLHDHDGERVAAGHARAGADPSP